MCVCINIYMCICIYFSISGEWRLVEQSGVNRQLNVIMVRYRD